MSVFTNPASSSKEQGKAYSAAVLDLVGARKPLDILERTEAELPAAIKGLNAKQLGQREAPKKWAIQHVLQHLADSELVWGWRLRLVLAQDRPPLTGYDQDAWADRLGYDEADSQAALRQFGVLRDANLRLVKRASPKDLQRVGVHAERGDESIAHMMKLYAGHDLLHLAQIERIKKTLA
jgi:hypothetical protein